MGHVSLHAQPRAEFGNGPTRRLRREGLVPAVVYQAGGPSLSLALPRHDLRRTLSEGRTSVIDLVIGDAPARPVLVKDWQLHPVHLGVLHVDFQEVDLKVAVEASVAVVLTGQSVGVRDGGVLDQTLREVIVSALPDSLPDHVELDVSELVVGHSITVGDIAVPAGVTLITDPETVVASVVAPSSDVGEEIVEEAEPEDVEGGDSSSE